MSTTFFAKQHIVKIDALNDQLWYYLFTTEELNKQLSRFSPKAKENFTVDLFSNNLFSKRIHVKVDQLNDFQNENKNATLGGYMAICYEICSKYIAVIFDKLKSINTLTAYDWDGRKPPEENLKELLKKEGLPAINNSLLDTLSYLRLRRNHYTHIIETNSSKLEAFIINKSPSLNTYWGQPGTTVHLDFSKTLVRNFEREETIELIKLIRICISEIDDHIASLLNKNSIINLLIEREMEGKGRLNADTQKSLISKVKYLCKSEYKLNVLTSEIVSFVPSI